MDIDTLTDKVFCNRQRTSSKGGILKSEAVRSVLNILYTFGIETKTDLLNFNNLDAVESEIRKIKGQTTGITFDYIMMHAGDNNRYKRDRQITNFFDIYLGYGKLDEHALRVAFKEQFLIVKEKYPTFTIKSLDNLIWNFIRTREAKFTTSLDDIVDGIQEPYFIKNKTWFVFNEKLSFYLLTNKAPKKALDSYVEFYHDSSFEKLEEILSAVESIDYYLGEKQFEPTKNAMRLIIKHFKQ